MSKITYPDKSTGDQFTGEEATQIKTIVNANDITADALKVEVDLNTAKTGITPTQASDITTNNAKTSYTEALVSANTSVTANTAKVGVTNEEENTINSVVSGEPTGSDVVLNVVSLTQAEYDAGTPVITTLYNITDA
jgi:hypothetical protein